MRGSWGLGRRVDRGLRHSMNAYGHAPAFGYGGAPSIALTRRQRVVGLGFVLGVVVVIGAFAMVSAPSTANRPALFGGSLVLENTLGEPVVIDLATGALTTRFARLGEYVDQQDPRPHVVPVDGGTLLVSDRGAVNFLGLDNYLVKKTAGVLLGRELASARAVAAGARAYVLASERDAMFVAAVDRSTLETNETLGATRLDVPFDARPGSFATAGGSVWIVTPGGELVDVGPDPDEPKQLLVTEHGDIPANAVLATGGATSSDGTRSIVVAADASRLRVFDATGTARPFDVPSGVDSATRVVPASGSERVIWFLYENAVGWHAVGVDTSDGKRVGPRRLDDPRFRAGPVVPGYADGRLYTLDARSAAVPADTPALLAIDPRTGAVDPVVDADGAPVTYALKTAGERTSFTDTQVIVRGPRVVFNNPLTPFAYVVFTDGSRPPSIVDKSDTRNQFDPTQSPGLLVSAPQTEDTTPEAESPTATTAPRVETPARAAVVDEVLDCTREDQRPHAPIIGGVSARPRAVTVAWSYETVDTRDCVPSTFIVSVRPLNGARAVANAVREVHGQQQITFDGLRPNSTYEFTVTARIGDNETPSEPVQIKTLPAGPEPPSEVTVTADPEQGVWTISWTHCGESCDVPVGGWVVQGVELCGPGNANALPVVTVPGGVTTATVPFGQLVGRSVRFEVYGRTPDGLNGDATSAPRCVEGWRVPQLDKLTFSAAPTRPRAGKIDALLSLAIDGSPLQVFGSGDVKLEYAVDGAVVATRGLPSGTRDEVTVAVTARQPHTATLRISSHGRAYTLTSPQFQENIPWAPIQLHAVALPAVTEPVAQIVVTATNLYVDAPNSTVVASGSLVCNNRRAPDFVDRPVDAAGVFTIDDVDLVEFGGNCRLEAEFREPAEPAVHEGPSPRVQTNVDLGVPQPGGPVGAFTAAWVGPEGPLRIWGTAGLGGDITMTIQWVRRDPDADCIAPTNLGRATTVDLVVDVSPCIEAAKIAERGRFRFSVVVRLVRRYLGVELRTEFESPVLRLQAYQEDPTTTTTTTPETTP